MIRERLDTELCRSVAVDQHVTQTLLQDLQVMTDSRVLDASPTRRLQGDIIIDAISLLLSCPQRISGTADDEYLNSCFQRGTFVCGLLEERGYTAWVEDCLVFRYTSSEEQAIRVMVQVPNIQDRI